jgi:Ni/Fe-hydrogenase subunit HybB-like protein
MTTQAQSANTGTLLIAGLAGVVVSLGVALSALLSQGHAAFNTSSDTVSWGLPVAAYVFFAVTSCGLTVIASLATVFGVKAFYPVAKRCIVLAGATLVGGMACLALEIGHVFRMIWALPLSFQIASAMWWMGVLYALDLVFMALKFQRVNAGDWDSPTSKLYGLLSLVFAVAATATLGLIFGMMTMRPFWYGGFVPVFFIAAGIVSAFGFATLTIWLAAGMRAEGLSEAGRRLMGGTMPATFAVALLVYVLAVAVRTITGLWSNADGLEAFDWMVGSAWFWVEIIGVVVAFAILSNEGTRSQPTMQVVAAVLAMVAVFANRYEYVIGGQIVPLFKGSWVPSIASYSPSVTEWMLALLALSLAFTIYALGDKMFGLGAAPAE